MDIEPAATTQQGSKQINNPATLDILAGSPPPKEHQTKKRKIDSVEESGSQEATNPFSPVKLQSVGQEEVLKFESCFNSWTKTNSIARAMEVVGAATQLAKQVTYLGCVVCRTSSERDQLENENASLRKEKAMLETSLKQKEDSLFVVEDQFSSLCRENASVEKKLVAAEEDKKKMNKKKQGLERQLAENKADADFSLFIVKDKVTYVLADQLATLGKEFPHHSKDIEEVYVRPKAVSREQDFNPGV